MARFDHIDKTNVEAFDKAVVDFAQRKGYEAGNRWLFKMNPWTGVHLSGEYAFTGGGYTSRHARSAVFFEFDNQAMPKPCPTKDCDGASWWRATVGALICPSCGEIDFESPHEHLGYILEDMEKEKTA